MLRIRKVLDSNLSPEIVILNTVFVIFQSLQAKAGKVP
jgi:hypothetical protein